MERRKFVIGLGALAAGSAAATGTGAFSQMTTTGRDMTVDIVNDDAASIALVPGSNSGKVAFIDDHGDLTIDLGADSGINTNSHYLFGDVAVGGDHEPSDIFEVDQNFQEESDFGTIGEDTFIQWYVTVYDGDDNFDGTPGSETVRNGEGSVPPMFDNNVQVSKEDHLFRIQNNSSTTRDIWLGVDSLLGNVLNSGSSGVGLPGQGDTPSWAVISQVPSSAYVAVAVYIRAGKEKETVEEQIRVSADRPEDVADGLEDVSET